MLMLYRNHVGVSRAHTEHEQLNENPVVVFHFSLPLTSFAAVIITAATRGRLPTTKLPYGL